MSKENKKKVEKFFYKEFEALNKEEIIKKIGKYLFGELLNKWKVIKEIEDGKFHFFYVGIIFYNDKKMDILIMVVPKYWPNSIDIKDDDFYNDKFLNVIKSVDKYYKNNLSNFFYQHKKEFNKWIFNCKNDWSAKIKNDNKYYKYLIISFYNELKWNISDGFFKDKDIKKMNKNDFGILKTNIFLLGTLDFEVIWERVCANYYDNSNEFTIDKNTFEMTKKDPFDPINKTVLKLLFNPTNKKNPNPEDKRLKLIHWKGPANLIGDKYLDGLKLDIIKIQEKKFSIFDAKYYFPKISLPGRADIIKQFLYQIAFYPVCVKNNLSFDENSLLFPVFNTEEFKDEEDCFVEIPILDSLSFNNGDQIKKIKLKFLDADEIFKKYIGES